MGAVTRPAPHGARRVIGNEHEADAVREADESNIRAARFTDVDRVAAIERASFSDPWSTESFARLLGDPRVHFAVAAVGDAVVGYVVAWFVVDEGEIANLAVTLDARGRGVGGRLLDSAVEMARRRRVAFLYLEVRDSNAAARALYGSRGFHEVARRRHYYRRPVEDALVLRLDLAPVH